MAVRQYVGARYVPKFYQNSENPTSSEWENGVAYEAMTVVTYNNSSYTSKIPVPAGIGNPASNPTYWVVTGAYNAQVEQYRQEVTTAVEGVDEKLNNTQTKLEGDMQTLKDDTDKSLQDLQANLVTKIEQSGIYQKVTNYGADPTGVNDSKQAFIDALSANETIVIPDGTYLISGNIITGNNKTIIGTRNAIITANLAQSHEQLPVTYYDNQTVFTLGDNCTVIGLHFKGQASFIRTGNNCTISGTEIEAELCNLNYNYIFGINIGDCSNVDIGNIYGHSAYCDFNDIIHVFGNVDYLNIHDSYLDCGDDSIALNGAEGTPGTISNVTINNCMVLGKGFRFYSLSSIQAHISNCEVHNTVASSPLILITNEWDLGSTTAAQPTMYLDFDNVRTYGTADGVSIGGCQPYLSFNNCHIHKFNCVNGDTKLVTIGNSIIEKLTYVLTGVNAQLSINNSQIYSTNVTGSGTGNINMLVANSSINDFKFEPTSEKGYNYLLSLSNVRVSDGAITAGGMIVVNNVPNVIIKYTKAWIFNALPNNTSLEPVDDNSVLERTCGFFSRIKGNTITPSTGDFTLTPSTFAIKKEDAWYTVDMTILG